ncbi:hypothetical protein EDD37DRAFT_41126 [Exophiala viscosa]|uniref:uncharacterized protein n=1 Tax=Exophiala viscosa TaxID=2486360 RepID=UPI00219025BF|nr:hypothetical protein EDD37DRAFT_41126 [Exophiala viscosa]
MRHCPWGWLTGLHLYTASGMISWSGKKVLTSPSIAYYYVFRLLQVNQYGSCHAMSRNSIKLRGNGSVWVFSLELSILDGRLQSLVRHIKS